MPRSTDPSSFTPGRGASEPTPGAVALEVHAATERAHQATQVEVEDPHGSYLEPNGDGVQGLFDQLAALVPPPPPGVGVEGPAWLGSTNTGRPDWGQFKLNHGAVPFTGNSEADPRAVYPYYYRAPVSRDGVGMTGTGLEPGTDPTFNVEDGTYTGGGPGYAVAGFVTALRSSPLGTYALPTWSLAPPLNHPFLVVSGIVAPADRGVLALVSWTPGDTSAPGAAPDAAATLARCPAAILLGEGLRSGGRDGAPGALFEESPRGDRARGEVDFAANPAAPYTITLDTTALGAAGSTYTFTAIAAGPAGSGQFIVGATPSLTAAAFAQAVNAVLHPHQLAALSEGGSTVYLIVRARGTAGNGVTVTASAVPVVDPSGGTDTAPNPRAFPGRAAGQFDLEEIHQGVSVGGESIPFPNPAAGQVRLLTDAGAFSATVNGGIPILGAGVYARGPGGASGSWPYGLDGGTAGNFFAYRLPYLFDYSAATGLRTTPEDERGRFFSRREPTDAPGDPLPTAGAYDDYRADWWGFQLARYRHRLPLGATSVGTLERYRSYALVHFKTERAFERYVRDGVAPRTADLYSVQLASWSGFSRQENWITAGPVVMLPGDPTAALSGPAGRGGITTDSAGATAPVITTAQIEYSVTTDTVSVSGVPYHIPRAVSSPGAAFGVSLFDLQISGLWDASYYTHDTIPSVGPLAADERRHALNVNPVMVSVGAFSRGGAEPGTHQLNRGGMDLFPGGLGAMRRGRVELGYADLTTAADPDPAVGDAATWQPYALGPPTLTLNFFGDEDPTFVRDAKVRVFVRRPLARDGLSTQPLPYVRRASFSTISGDRVLFHGQREDFGGDPVVYGNAADPGRVTRNSIKDADERFLDEVYRYELDWSPILDGRLAQLTGPGLPGGVGAIDVPVRPGSDPDYPGWYGNSTHVTALPAGEAQVGGWPDRDPPFTDGVTEPYPSLGVLMYPEEDYSTGCDPVGPDYSATTGDVAYVRAFDAGATRVGATRVVVRVWGVELSDFAYALPGPGGPNLAVLVKVPGLTTWMDAGRLEGTGPSKQSPADDGAGCLVPGPGTYTEVDAATQLTYAQVEVELGAGGGLFLNSEGRCPVLVKVVLKDTAGGRGMNLANVPATSSNTLIRGVVRIQLLAPEVEVPGPTPWTTAGGDLGGEYPNPTVTSGAHHTHAVTQITGAPWTGVTAPTSRRTTDATPTTLGSIATATDQGHALDLLVSATLSDRSSQVSFKILGSVTNALGTVDVRNALISADDGGTSGLGVALVPSGTSILIVVTGAPGVPIDWTLAGIRIVHGS